MRLSRRKAKGVIEAFDVTGFASGSIHCLMPFGGQNAGISVEEIGVADLWGSVRFSANFRAGYGWQMAVFSPNSSDL